MTTTRPAPHIMQVLRTADGRYLGRGGKHLTYELVDLDRACPYLGLAAAETAARHASAVLGVHFTVENRLWPEKGKR